MTCKAHDREGNEIRIGGRVFIRRDQPSVPVVGLMPFVSRRLGAYWVQVDNGVNGLEWFFDIAVRVDPSAT